MLHPGEQVIFPAPFVPTEFHPLVVTNRRVVQFTPGGQYPTSDFELTQVDFIGRMSERPFIGIAVLIAAVGLILLIVAGWKLLPPILHAGHKADGSQAQMTEDGRIIEGKDDQDDYPFFDKENQEKAQKLSLERMKKLKEIKPGIPPLNREVGLGLLFLVLSVGTLVGASSLYKREQFFIFCRTKDNNVHRLETQSEMQQNMVLASLQAAHQAVQKG